MDVVSAPWGRNLVVDNDILAAPDLGRLDARALARLAAERCAVAERGKAA